MVDRVSTRPDLATRLADSIETALRLADGIAIAEFADETDGKEPRRMVFSEKFACPVSGFTIAEIEPRLFSFNAPTGACPTCDGLGTTLRFEPDLVVPDDTLSLAEGAILPWAQDRQHQPLLHADAGVADRPLRRRDDDAVAGPAGGGASEVILYGSKREKIQFIYDDGLRAYNTSKTFEGVDHQHRAALERDRVDVGARGAVALPVRRAVRGVQRLPPQARGAGGEDQPAPTSARSPRSPSAMPRPGSRHCPST